jgi:hypothetical protein
MLVTQMPSEGLRNHINGDHCIIKHLIECRTGYGGDDHEITHGFLPGAGSQRWTERQKMEKIVAAHNRVNGECIPLAMEKPIEKSPRARKIDRGRAFELT